LDKLTEMWGKRSARYAFGEMQARVRSAWQVRAASPGKIDEFRVLTM
jgi:hypothetical protein